MKLKATALALVFTAMSLTGQAPSGTETEQPGSAPVPNLPPQPIRLPEATWHDVWHIQFKAAAITQGFTLWTRIENAWSASQLPTGLILKMRTGKWNLIAAAPLPGGVRDLEWLVSPHDAQFWSALAEQEGGAARAMELWTAFVECIQEQAHELGYAAKLSSSAGLWRAPGVDERRPPHRTVRFALGSEARRESCVNTARDLLAATGLED